MPSTTSESENLDKQRILVSLKDASCLFPGKKSPMVVKITLTPDYLFPQRIQAQFHAWYSAIDSILSCKFEVYFANNTFNKEQINELKDLKKSYQKKLLP